MEIHGLRSPYEPVGGLVYFARMIDKIRLHAAGLLPSEYEEVEIWNDYLSKRCWRDRYTPRLHIRLQEAGWPIGTVLTMFDFVDLDEGLTSGSR